MLVLDGVILPQLYMYIYETLETLIFVPYFCALTIHTRTHTHSAYIPGWKEVSLSHNKGLGDLSTGQHTRNKNSSQRRTANMLCTHLLTKSN